jgi:hypothetical protein
MNRKILIKPAANQGNIQLLFSKAESAAKTEQKAAKAETMTNTLQSTQPEVQEFYNSLTKAEVLAHTIAIEKLGTSYDVTRTHGYAKWQAMRKAKS